MFDAVGERRGKAAPTGGHRGRSEALDQRAALRKQLADGGLHISRRNGIEAW